jgi:hypothetical protein
MDDENQRTLDGFFKKLAPGQKAPFGMPVKRTPELETALAARQQEQADKARAAALARAAKKVKNKTESKASRRRFDINPLTAFLAPDSDEVPQRPTGVRGAYGYKDSGHWPAALKEQAVSKLRQCRPLQEVAMQGRVTRARTRANAASRG